ncbi:MAG: hypothetical protein ACM3ZB_09680 [bacterium]
MTKREAVAVNVVLTALIEQKQVLDAVGFRAPKESAIGLVTEHAANLARKAHRVLGAGLSDEDVERAWRGEVVKAQRVTKSDFSVPTGGTR